MNLLRYFFTLFVVLFSYSLLSAQDVDKDGEFYLDFAGSAVFPYNPKGQLGHGVKAGAGLTAAFGYAFKEGFSTEIEWGHQKVGIGNPTGNLSHVTIPGVVVRAGDFAPSPSYPLDHHGNRRRNQDPVSHGKFLLPLSQMEGESLRRFRSGSFLPRWSCHPHGHLRVRRPPGVIGPGGIIIRPGDIPTEILKATVAYEDSRFAYQIMVGLSVRVSPLLEFHTGYRFRSSRGGPIDADCIEAGIRFRF